MTPGIYEILDANHKRACWGPRVDRGRQNSSRLREANEFFNIGRRLGQYRPVDPVITRHRT